MSNSFVPNWKTKFKSKEESWGHIINCLVENRNAICSRSLDGTATFMLGGRMITLKGKKKK